MDLVNKYQSQRDEYKLLRDSLQDLLGASLKLQEDYRVQREHTEDELVIVEAKYLTEARRVVEMEAQLEGTWSDWEVALFTGGVSATALLVGAGVTALVFEVTQ